MGVEAVAEAIISIVAAAAAAEAVVVDLLLLLKPQAEGSRFAVLVVFVTLNQDIEVTILFAKIALQITCTSSLAVSMGPNDCRTGRITRHAPILRGREAVVVVVVVAVAVVEAISNNSNMGNSSSSSSSSNRPIMGRQDLQQMCKILSKILNCLYASIYRISRTKLGAGYLG